MKLSHVVAATSALLALVAAPRVASACGGTFCDRGPQAMPVDQRGEDIVFVQDGATVEAHIQIAYEGNARQFAWVIPVQALPTFEVGSNALFTALKSATVPTYGFQTRFDTCDDSRNFGAPTSASDGAQGASGAAGASGGGGPTIVYKATVGAFDITVLKGGSVSEVVDWLDTNGYQQSDKAPPILQKYLSKSYFFAAVKLVGGAGTNEIHPLVVKYHGDKPCVPLELTAIAAKEDMYVRTFFLGAGRVYPLNYRHVVLNPLSLDWTRMGADYNDKIGRAVDSPIADGRAFVTDYAGPSSVVPPTFASPSWNSQALLDTTPAQALSVLEQQGLLSCFGKGSTSGQCQFNHPLLEGILDTYLPPPATVAAANYYACLSCVPGSLGKWDAVKLAADVQDRIIAPAKHAEQILKAHPFLTRLLTTISPAEMTEDPEFVTTTDQDAVTQTQQGTLRVLCTQERVMTLPDGREVAYEADGTYPKFGGAMPGAERVEVIDASGKRSVLVDNRAAIDAKLAEHNRSRNWPATYTPSDKSDLEKLTGCTVGLGAGDAGGLALVGLAAAGLVRRRRRA